MDTLTAENEAVENLLILNAIQGSLPYGLSD
jgi:hypothetical protein